jgi:broad specificity phosphatase PhoE
VTTVHVVRHARAGRRDEWRGPDEERPLSKAGRRQAERVADRLVGKPITRVVSSPYARCIQSVEPLAERLGLTVDVADALAEGVHRADVMSLLDKCAHEETLLCTHGDVIDMMLDEARKSGIKLKHTKMEKGSTWELKLDQGTITAARYRPAL